MPRIPIPFVGPAYEARSSRLNAQRCVNLYPELDESPKGKSVAALFGTPGLTVEQTFPGRGGVRGMHRTSRDGRPFLVQGDRLYEMKNLTERVDRGQIAGHSSPVYMDDTGLDLCIVADQRGWIFDLDDNTLTEITDPDFLGAGTVTSLDGYFIFNRPDTTQFFWSNLLDGLTYTGTDFASADSSPDKLIAARREHRELWLFGENTTEVWYNSGDANQPFQRIQNAYLEQGVLTPDCIVSLANTLYWVGRNTKGQGVVWRANGYNQERISTHAIEYAMNATDLGNVSAYGYQEEGHWFYVLNTATHTWAYDVTNALWHERAGLGLDGHTEPHPAGTHMFAFDKHLAGDRTQPLLYSTCLETFDNAGMPLPRIRVAPYFSADRVDVFHQRLELDLQVGLGTSTGSTPQTDPQVWLNWSDDHGKTWSSGHLATIGKQGEYETRAIWRRLGRSRDRLYRVTITDPIPVQIVGAFLEVTV